MNREELLKNAKPILFNTKMVQAILEGRKTVTRRLVKPKYKKDEGGFQVCTNKATGERWIEKHDWDEGSFDNPRYVNSPYQAGDILYVRETWQRNYCNDVIVTGKYAYRASPETWQYFSEEEKNFKKKWKPSIHMPKVAARIFLKVTDVRVERLQDMTDEDCIAEGIKPVRVPGSTNYREEREFQIACGIATIEKYEELWDSTIKKQDLDKYSWEANPWVWVIEFERVEVENE